MPSPLVVPFGPFEPDSADLNSGVLSVATNVYPSKTGYVPMKGLGTSITGIQSWTPAYGAFVIQTGAAAYSLYAVGTSNIIRVDSSNLASGTLITPVAGLTASSHYWRAAKFGTSIIFAFSGNDVLVGDWSSAAAALTALSGSPPRASGVFTIGDFVFLTGLASNKRKLQWSAINDHTGWTVGTNLSDEQEFPDGGDIFGIAGDKNGYVIQQNAIRSFQFLPGDTATIFQFSKVDGVPGCASQYAWAKAGQSIYYYSEEGFCSIGPGGFRSIGAHRVDRYFLNQSPTLSTMYAVADPYFPRVYFLANPTSNTFDIKLVYDWQLDRWSETDIDTALFFDHIDGTGGGAQIILGATGSANPLSGANRSGTLTTADLEIFQTGANGGKRANILKARPLVNGAVTSVAASHKESLDDSYTTATSTTQETNGWFTFGTSQTSGVYHKFSVVTTASNTAAYHTGLQLQAIPDGEA